MASSKYKLAILHFEISVLGTAPRMRFEMSGIISGVQFELV